MIITLIAEIVDGQSYNIFYDSKGYLHVFQFNNMQ